MHKKLIMACMAIAAFAAFVIAPAASATNLTENGETIEVGASVTGKNTTGTTTTFTGGGIVVTCTFGHMSGSVTADSGGTIAGQIPAGNAVFKGTGAGEDCTSGLGDTKPTVNSKLCLHVNNSDAGTVTGCGTNITFSLDVTNVITCRYSVASINTVITTGPNVHGAGVNVVEQSATEEDPKQFLCPDTGKLNMEFYLTTTDGTPLEFS